MIDNKFNSNFVSELTSADSGIRKQAAANFNEWLVTYQRQDGVFRKYMPPKPVTEADFAEEIDNRDPVVYRTIKPRSAGAISTNFDTGTISTGMYANKYKTYLHRAWTPKYRIDKVYLTAYKGDLLGVFKDLSLQDLLGLEDLEGMSLINSRIGAHGVVNEEIGMKQYIYATALGNPETDANTIAHVVSGLTNSTDNLSPAKALVHRSLWYKLVNAMRADHVGERIAEGAILGDMSALEESLLGIRWVTVLETKLVPQNTAYISADNQYCGDFLTYGEAQIFTEIKDAIWIEMFAHETYGMAMPYRGCVVRADFISDSNESWTA